MAKNLPNYNGNIKMSGGFTARGDFPLMEVHDVLASKDGTRLDALLKAILERLILLEQMEIPQAPTLSSLGITIKPRVSMLR